MIENRKENFEEVFVFWKNLVLIVVFFLITPLTLGISLFSLYNIKPTENNQTNIILENSAQKNISGVRVYASLPSDTPMVNQKVSYKDARPEIIKQYLKRYNSPLEPYSSYLVTISDKYELDFRLLPAIAQQESNLCKIIPQDGHNCWGWGIHSKGTLGFNSFEEGIETVAYGLKTEYIDKGYNTPEEIMSKYTPLSNGSWAMGVTQFMSEME